MARKKGGGSSRNETTAKRLGMNTVSVSLPAVLIVRQRGTRIHPI